MKIVIDIPEKTNAHIRSDYGHGVKGLRDEDREIVCNAIYAGTPYKERPNGADMRIKRSEQVERARPCGSESRPSPSNYYMKKDEQMRDWILQGMKEGEAKKETLEAIARGFEICTENDKMIALAVDRLLNVLRSRGVLTQEEKEYITDTKEGEK